MTAHRVLLFENPSFLSVDVGRIKVAQPNKDPIYFLARDVDVVCFHHPVISITNAVMQAFSSENVVLIVTDQKHYPCGWLLPFEAQFVATRRLREQISFMSSGMGDALWKQVVVSKIKNQSYALKKLNKNGAVRLKKISLLVEPGDPNNMEATAARIYWRCIGGGKFKRIKQAKEVDFINAKLNFGYAILRSLIARELAVSGLNMSLGIGHQNTENHFNLVDDLMEPYRFMVDLAVFSDAEVQTNNNDFTGAEKQLLIKNIYKSVTLPNGNVYKLPIAVKETVNSYVHALESKECNREHDLIFPVEIC